MIIVVIVVVVVVVVMKKLFVFLMIFFFIFVVGVIVVVGVGGVPGVGWMVRLVRERPVIHEWRGQLLLLLHFVVCGECLLFA